MKVNSSQRTLQNMAQSAQLRRFEHRDLLTVRSVGHMYRAADSWKAGDYSLAIQSIIDQKAKTVVARLVDFPNFVKDHLIIRAANLVKLAKRLLH